MMVNLSRRMNASAMSKSVLAKTLGTCVKLYHRPKKAIFKKGGRNKLTDAAINYIQNCHGLAIRQNTNNFYQMKKKRKCNQESLF